MTDALKPCPFCEGTSSPDPAVVRVVEALREALALADAIVMRLPANGAHWQLLERYCAAASEAGAALSAYDARTKG